MNKLREHSETRFRSETATVSSDQAPPPTRLILRNNQSPGDVTMLTAAVRDLHASYPGQFVTDVRGECPDLWLHNPHLTPLSEEDPTVRIIHCRYPIINYSNQRPYHFLHGFIHFLNRELRLGMRLRAIKGDIHLSEKEQQMPSAVTDILGREIPFWIVAAGGKTDYTVKWWSTERFQSVVNSLRGRVLFVQVGLEEHHHPALHNVIDLRGKTSLRELVRLIHHAQGVLSPVTAAMHLAAAVPVKAGAPGLRPCVVVAGGREPPHWESYPNHQFIHTVGMLTCCETGGCWRKRTVPLNDGDKRDLPENLCLQVVDGPLPRCMSMVTPEEVVRRIEGYFAGGIIRYLLPDEVTALTQAGTWSNK